MTWFGRRWSLQRSHPITNDGFGPITPMTGNAQTDRLVRNNSDLFSAKGEPIRDSQLEALSINTNSRPICQKANRTPLTKRKIVEDSITEMLRDDIIEPSSSPWASPIVYTLMISSCSAKTWQITKNIFSVYSIAYDQLGYAFLISRWDPHWSVIRVKGPVLWSRHQQSAKENVLHRDKVKLVDSTTAWDDCNPRPQRSQYQVRLAKTMQLTRSPLGAQPRGPSRRSHTPLSPQGEDTPTNRRATPSRKRRRISCREQGESPQVITHLDRQIRTRQDSRRARDGDIHTVSEPQFQSPTVLKTQHCNDNER